MSTARLVRSIGKIIKEREKLARQAEREHSVEVKNILLSKTRDAGRIEKLLDGILDFCFDPAMLGLYKKLCRYYYDIDPSAAAAYAYAYRDMWEDEGLKDKKANLASHITAVRKPVKKKRKK